MGRAEPASHLAAPLAAHLGAQVVAIDDLIPGWTGFGRGAELARHGLVEPIAQGHDGGYRRYDWVAASTPSSATSASRSTSCVEGCGSGSRTLAPYLSLLVWVDADRELRFERGIARDGEPSCRTGSAGRQESQELFPGGRHGRSRRRGGRRHRRLAGDRRVDRPGRPAGRPAGRRCGERPAPAAVAVSVPTEAPAAATCFA